MTHRIYKVLSSVLIAVLLVIAMPFVNGSVNAAGDIYKSAWQEYDLGHGNKGYYLEPADDGKYPAVIFVHGLGGISGIPKDSFRNLIEYWTHMGYIDKAVVIIPSIVQGSAPSEYEAYRYWGQYDSQSGLLGQKIKDGSFSSKIDPSEDIILTGFSLGGCCALAAGIEFGEYYSHIGAFSPSFFLYSEGEEGTWFRRWYENPEELKYDDGTDIFISYGSAEGASSSTVQFKTSSERYTRVIRANNNDSVNVNLHSFDSSFGGHAWKLFSAELFAYLYELKNGELPSDELINSALNVPTIYSVSYNANGHGIAPSTQTVYSGERIVRPEDPSASGYTFGGWFTDSACTNSYDFSKEVTSGLMLYAKWTTETGSNTTPVIVPSSELLIGGSAHVQDFGDRPVKVDPSTGIMTIGTRGQAKRLEEILIDFQNTTGYEGGMEYRVHVQDIGWMDWTPAGTPAGTEGMAKRLEAIEIRLTGELAKHYSVEYCAHIQDYGDAQGWVRDGALAGTTGESKRIEEIKVRIVPIGRDNTTSVNYRVHVQDYGWENKYVADGAMSGTSGQSKRLEGIEIHLSGCQYTGGIRYRTHIQNIGWESTWARDGEMSGTQGKALRLEAIQIELYGDMAAHYDIYYRVHAQDIGWMSWASNGAEAGTAARSARLEGIQIVLVPKGSAAPGKTYQGITAVDSRAFVNGF